MTPTKLGYSQGKVSGANVTHNSPWPCPNGNADEMSVPRGIMGVVMHTMVGNLPGTISEFNNESAQASAHFGIDQDGNIHQFGPVNGWKAWAQEAGNTNWYSIEHADNGNPANPLTAAQVSASAQVVELLSRPDVGNFALQVSNSTAVEGYGVHYTGGAAWGGHSCPQLGDGSGPRAGQRTAIVALAKAIRGGTPAVRSWTCAGQSSLAVLAHDKLKENPSTILRVTCENSPSGFFAANLAGYIGAVFAADTVNCPAGVTWFYPGLSGPAKWVTAGQLPLAALAVNLHVGVSTVLRMTAELSAAKQYPPANASYINDVFGRSAVPVPKGVVLYY